MSLKAWLEIRCVAWHLRDDSSFNIVIPDIKKNSSSGVKHARPNITYFLYVYTCFPYPAMERNSRGPKSLAGLNENAKARRVK